MINWLFGCLTLILVIACWWLIDFLVIWLWSWYLLAGGCLTLWYTGIVPVAFTMLHCLVQLCWLFLDICTNMAQLLLDLTSRSTACLYGSITPSLVFHTLSRFWCSWCVFVTPIMSLRWQGSCGNMGCQTHTLSTFITIMSVYSQQQSKQSKTANSQQQSTTAKTV